MPAPDLKSYINNTLKELRNAYERRIPVKVGNAAINYYKENFAEGGWNGKAWQEPIRRKAGFVGLSGRYKTLTSGRNNLFNSFDKIISPGKVKIINPVIYASVHNNGGTITVTARMKKYFWARYIEIVGTKTKQSAFRYTKKGKVSKSKYNQSLGAEAQFWKAMALKKVGSSITIPKRQIVGTTPELEKEIDRIITQELTRVANGNSINRPR